MSTIKLIITHLAGLGAVLTVLLLPAPSASAQTSATEAWITLQAAERIVAYAVPAGTAGNQEDFSGVIGMDFEVANPIVLTQIGVFDDNSDGLRRAITARIYDRSDPIVPIPAATMEFTREEPGTLIGGSRFKALPTPLRLEPGFLGTIAAENYGPEERLRNILGMIGYRNWSLNDGNGSLVFVGKSRYGTLNGEYPDAADSGPADRYAAGTFQFETTPPLGPGAPLRLTIEPADGTITVRWPAITNPLPAVKYEVFRASSLTGEFQKVGETTTTEYVERGLSNGQVYCYKVWGIGAGGQVGLDSPPICAAPYVLPAGQIVALRVNAGVSGNVNHDLVSGMDFEIANAIIITHLGVFDDASDGLQRSITVRIWDRAGPNAPTEVVNLEFTPENSGTLIGGSRFRPLPSPIRLEPGFRGTISTENYGAGEGFYTVGGDPLAARPWTIGSGSGSLRFTGSDRYGSAGAFPDTLYYATNILGAGTFQFQTTALVNPGIPELAVLGGDQAVTLSWAAVNEPVAAAKYRILRGTADGELSQVAEVTSLSYTDAGLTKNTEYCYSVVGVSVAGQAGAGLTLACLTVEAREPGVAYVVEAGTSGNQAFGGALGMEFDVLRAISVTRLGVFDDSSDGLFLPINARLYDRTSLQVVAQLDFTTDDAGELIGGSRFKTLPLPLLLPAGFKGTMVASGYGEGEQNGAGIPWHSMFGGGGSLAFVRGRYSVYSAAYPETPDVGGYANPYAAGTFYFEPGTEPPRVALTRSGTRLAITWTGGVILESAPTVRGTWAPVVGAASGIEVEPTGAAAFYRVRQ